MSNMSEEVFAKPTKAESKRSDYLTGLCLFSFIGNGWGLLCGIVQFIKADAQTRAVNRVKDILVNDEFQRNASSDTAAKIAINMAEGMAAAFTTDNLIIISIATFVSSLLCMIGVSMMWQLKKKGFYFYVAGIATGIVTLLLLFGFSKVFTMGMLALNGIITLFVLFGASSQLATFISITIGLFWVLFIFLYSRHLKSMT